MKSNYLAEKYSKEDKYKVPNPSLATGDFHSTRNYEKENLKKLGTPISESSSVLRDANSYDHLLNSRHKNKNDISEFSSPDLSSYKNLENKRGPYLEAFSDNKQRVGDGKAKEGLKYKSYFKGEQEDTNIFSETSQLKSGQSRSSIKKGTDALDMPEPQYKSEFATTAMFKTTLHDKKEKVRESLNGYQISNRDSQISNQNNVSNINNLSANGYALAAQKEAGNLKESRVANGVTRENFDKTLFSPKNRCLSPEYGRKKDESDSRVLCEKAENEYPSMSNKNWEKLESKQDKIAKLNEEISERRRCFEEMKKQDKKKAVVFQEKQNLQVDGDPSIDRLTIERSPKSVFTSNSNQVSLLNSRHKPKERLEESTATADPNDKFKKTLRGLGAEGGLLTTSRHKMSESSQSQSSNTSNESSGGQNQNQAPASVSQLQSNNKMASSRSKGQFGLISNNFGGPSVSQVNLLSPSTRGSLSAHNQSVTSNCSENSRDLIKSQEKREIFKGKSEAESFSQLQESPGSNKDYMKFMKKKKDQYEYITNINPSSTYQNREFSENKRKEENSEIIKAGGGSDQEALGKIRAMLKAKTDENLAKRVEELVNELETHKKFYECLSRTILECSSQGSFPEKPSLKQVWKWIKNLMSEYMQLKLKVKGGDKFAVNEAPKKRGDDSQNESVQRMRKEEKREFYNKAEELGDKRSPQRSYFEELERKTKEGSGLKTMGLK